MNDTNAPERQTRKLCIANSASGTLWVHTSQFTPPDTTRRASCRAVWIGYNVGGLALWQRRSSYERSCSTLSQVSTGIGDRLRAGIPPWYLTKPAMSTQPCIPLESSRVPASIGWGKGGNVTSAGCQITLCDLIWHVSSRSGAVLVAQTAIRFLTLMRKHYRKSWSALRLSADANISNLARSAKLPEGLYILPMFFLYLFIFFYFIFFMVDFLANVAETLIEQSSPKFQDS